MPRVRSPNRDKAYQLWIDSNKTKLLKDIAIEVGVSEIQIRKWKNIDKWDEMKGNVTNQMKGNVTNQRGAPKANKNAKGNKGGAAPPGNMNSLKHGAYSRYKELSDEEKELIAALESRTPYELMEDEYKGLVIKEYRLSEEIKTEKENVKGLNIKDITTRKLVFDGTEQNETTTHVSSTFERIMRLEAELTKVRAQKIKCINNIHKMGMDIKKFEHDKYRNEIELELKIVRLELDKAKVNMDDEIESEDDGFLDALSIEVENVWED